MQFRFHKYNDKKAVSREQKTLLLLKLLFCAWFSSLTTFFSTLATIRVTLATNPASLTICRYKDFRDYLNKLHIVPTIFRVIYDYIDEGGSDIEITTGFIK